MNRVPVKSVFLFTLFICLLVNGLQGQTWYLSPAVYKAIVHQCAVCLKYSSDSARILPVNKEFGEAAINFHNSHVTLKNGNLDAGYQYVLKTLMATGNTPSNPVVFYAEFLKARILYYKSLNKEALSEYLQLLRYKDMHAAVTAAIYASIAGIFAEQNNYTKALQFYETVQNQYLSFYEPYTQRRIYTNTGICYHHVKRYREADSSFQKAIFIARQIKDTLGLANVYSSLANMYYDRYIDDSAIAYFEKALYFATYLKDINLQAPAYKNMAVIEADRKRFDKAYQYIIKYDKLKDSIWNRDKIGELKDREKKLAVQEKELKLQLAQKQYKLQAVELSKRNWQRNTLFILAVLFLSFAAFIYRAYQQKAKRNKIISAQREELDELNQTKDQLFSILSHDLRTHVYTLNVTLSRLRIALSQDQLTLAAALAESTEKISSSTYALLNNLLHWALSQTSQLSYKPERISLRTVVDEVYNDLLPVAATKMITLRDTAPDELVFIADMNTVKIIVRNLIDNAIKYTPANGTITISGEQSGNYCNITVKDTGIGMEQSMADSIVNNKNKPIQKDTSGNRSTGLGLWLVRNMTEKNGGKIFIRSEKGKGTSVSVMFPLAADD